MMEANEEDEARTAFAEICAYAPHRHLMLCDRSQVIAERQHSRFGRY